jgi:hypothetical protein
MSAGANSFLRVSLLNFASLIAYPNREQFNQNAGGSKMRNARLCQLLSRPGGFATTWRAARWGMLLLVTGTACATSITISDPVIK